MCDCRIDWLWVQSSLDIYLNLYFNFFALVSRQSAALISAIQPAMPPESAESGERSVLTPGPLCLPYCVRDTA